jgi:hypothetical protein
MDPGFGDDAGMALGWCWDDIGTEYMACYLVYKMLARFL